MALYGIVLKLLYKNIAQCHLSIQLPRTLPFPHHPQKTLLFDAVTLFLQNGILYFPGTYYRLTASSVLQSTNISEDIDNMRSKIACIRLCHGHSTTAAINLSISTSTRCRCLSTIDTDAQNSNSAWNLFQPVAWICIFSFSFILYSAVTVWIVLHNRNH